MRLSTRLSEPARIARSNRSSTRSTNRSATSISIRIKGCRIKNRESVAQIASLAPTGALNRSRPLSTPSDSPTDSWASKSDCMPAMAVTARAPERCSELRWKGPTLPE
jgi:hypothetical protein